MKHPESLWRFVLFSGFFSRNQGKLLLWTHIRKNQYIHLSPSVRQVS